MAFLAGLAGMALFLLAVWTWNVLLRRQVRRQTETILVRERALQESEKNFRTFFETIDDLILVSTHDGNILYTNPAVNRKLGFSPEELESMHLLDVHPPEKRSEAEAIFAVMLQGGMDVYPLPLQSKDGSLLPVETRVWMGQWNGIDCIYGISKDLRKEQEALQLFDRIFRQNPAVMAITRVSDNVFIDVNEAFLKTLGYGREEIFGKTASELGLFVTPLKQQEAKEKLRNTQQLADVELDVRCKDGSVRNGLFYGDVIESQGQQHYLTVMIDQTRRKQAEEALTTEYAFRNAIIEHMAEGLCVCHQIEQHPFFHFTIWNPNMVSITGYTLEEINHAGWCPLMAPDEATAIRGMERIRRSFQQDDLRNEEWPILRKDGRLRWVRISTSVLKSDGGRIHVLALLEDITEQKRMEAEQREMEKRLQQIEKAEALSRMAGAIAHHFNNQLMVILGNLDMAREHCQEDENARRSLIAMRKATQKAAEISHLMLIYAGSDFKKKDAIDLNELCKTQVPLIEASLPNHIRLKTAFSEPGLNALANVGQIQKALMHLITNAVEAIGDRPGTIHISLDIMSGSDIPVVHRYPIDRQPRIDGSYACITVSDTGCGIADDDLHRIMDPFFTSKFTGRGMGLAFVLGILRGHDGFLCVESEPKRGGTFRIFLPRVEAKATTHPVSVYQQPDFHAEGQVLVVEDEPLVLDVTETILKRLGFTVVRAANGLEALQVFEKSPEQFRFVISDLAMPYLDGWELLSAMRRIRSDIPVILASGYNEAHVLKGEHAERPQAVLEKPYQIQELIAAIQQIVVPKHV